RRVKLAVAISFCAPRRQRFEVLIEFHDPRAALIDDVERLVRCHGDLAWPVKSRVRPLPIGDETAIAGEFLDLVIGRFGNVNVASPVDSDSIGVAQLAVTASFCSETREESARRR